MKCMLLLLLLLLLLLVKLFDVEYYRDLEMLVRGHSVLLKMVESLGTAVSLAISETFNVKE